MIVGIIGGRDLHGVAYDNDLYINNTLDALISAINEPFSLVTGGGKGVEQMVVRWAAAHKIEVQCIPPNIKHLGHEKAFSARNNKIVTTSDTMVFFWDGTTSNIPDAIALTIISKKKAIIHPML